MEQLEDGVDVVGEVDRLSAMVGGLSALVAESRGAGGADLDLRARYFAHEVNRLVTGISGRAQRAMISGDPDQARVAMELAADVGLRVASLCEFFMAQGGNRGGSSASDNHYRIGRNTGVSGRGWKGLDGAQVLAVHENAKWAVGNNVGFDGVKFVIELNAQGRLPIPAELFERVLVNLYSNSIAAMEGLGEEGVERVIRLRGRMVRARHGACVLGGKCVSCLGDCVVPGYFALAVEDSGPGMGLGVVGGSGTGSGSGSGSGHGLGLGVCRYVCEEWGGEFLVEASDGESGLGGLRVEMRFGEGCGRGG